MKIDNFPLYVNKMMSSLDLQAMTPCEFGIYMRIFLLSFIQEDQCYIINDEKKLLKATGATIEQWQNAKEIVLKEFKEENGHLYNENLLNVYKEELKKQKKLNKKQASEITGVLNYSFDEFWHDYDKKVGSRERLIPKWIKLTDKEREIIKLDIPKRKEMQPKKNFRSNPEKYLNQKEWTHELVDYRPKTNQVNKNNDTSNYNDQR